MDSGLERKLGVRQVVQQVVGETCLLELHSLGTRETVHVIEEVLRW